MLLINSINKLHVNLKAGGMVKFLQNGSLSHLVMKGPKGRTQKENKNKNKNKNKRKEREMKKRTDHVPCTLISH
jgi:hypothetical protein